MGKNQESPVDNDDGPAASAVTTTSALLSAVVWVVVVGQKIVAHSSLGFHINIIFRAHLATSIFFYVSFQVVSISISICDGFDLRTLPFFTFEMTHIELALISITNNLELFTIELTLISITNNL